jgi:hypothetical protein
LERQSAESLFRLVNQLKAEGSEKVI